MLRPESAPELQPAAAGAAAAAAGMARRAAGGAPQLAPRYDGCRARDSVCAPQNMHLTNRASLCDRQPGCCLRGRVSALRRTEHLHAVPAGWVCHRRFSGRVWDHVGDDGPIFEVAAT